VKRHWIKTYTQLPTQRPFSVAQSWDTAFKKTDTSNYNCCGTWYEFDSGYYLDDVWVEKCEYPELKSTVISKESERRPHFVLVEDKATGTPIMQELSIDTKINFIPILPEGDKVQRAHSISPTFESGNIYIWGDASWSQLVIDQLTMFPNCKIKDIMDMLSQYITYMRQHPSYSLANVLGGSTSRSTEDY